MDAGDPAIEAHQAVTVENAGGAGPLVLVCDHASNFFPAPYDSTLNLTDADKCAHIAWDPGALGVAEGLSKALDAPLVASCISRLVIDCNREEDRADLIPCLSETTEITGNRDLSVGEKTRRLDLAHRPFHEAIETLIGARLAKGLPTALVSIHTFTPVYKGVTRPWEIGLIYESDRRLADPVLADLNAEAGLTVGDNEPYSPADGVYYTIRRHGQDRELPCLMIEIRNDEVTTPEAEARWAALLAPMLRRAAGAATFGDTGAADA